MRLIVFGRQGAGKGTQCVKLSDHLGIPHISTGDMLRAAVEEGTEIGRTAETYLKGGHLVPDDVMAEVVAERLAKKDAQQGFLLDGFPRTLPQAEALLAILDGSVDVVVNLDVPVPVVRQRMIERNRDDDTPEAIDTRLAAYEADTVPVMELFERRGELIVVDGEGEIDEIFARLTAALGV
jgi:adenylate kinase